jgi:hypothetical protein
MATKLKVVEDLADIVPAPTASSATSRTRNAGDGRILRVRAYASTWRARVREHVACARVRP